MSTPIEMTTNCPSDETLAAFVDGRLAESERREVIQHVATCEICYDITSATWDYQAAEANVEIPEAAAKLAPPNVVPLRKWKPWLPAAAAIAAALAIVFLTPVRERLFPSDMGRLVAASKSVKERPIAGRLSGFPHKEWSNPRGDGDGDEDKERDTQHAMAAVAYDVLAKNENRTTVEALHATGAAHLMLRKYDPKGGHTVKAVQALSAAVIKDAQAKDLSSAIQKSSNAPLLNDLSTALYAQGVDYDLALDAANRSWGIAKTPEAAWNRAWALEGKKLVTQDEALEEKLSSEAKAAWQQYLALDRDPDSPWAIEAKEQLKLLD